MISPFWLDVFIEFITMIGYVLGLITIAGLIFLTVSLIADKIGVWANFLLLALIMIFSIAYVNTDDHWQQAEEQRRAVIEDGEFVDSLHNMHELPNDQPN